MASNIWKKRLILTEVSLAALLGCQVAVDNCSTAALADEPANVISLNNEGVKALNANNYQLAITKFEAALKLDPSYKLARGNLAIAHNNFGLQLRSDPKRALSEFHKALFLDPSNTTTLSNVNGIISLMGKNPKSFDDRKALGKEAQVSGDFIGALIEYGEACKIKDEPALHVEMGNIYRVRDDNDNAITQYQAAARLKDGADVEVKLGQAYLAKKDVPNAIASFGRALQLKPDDQDVLDALFVGWNEALKINPLAPENHIGLGQALQYRGDFGQAEKEYRLAIQLSPGHQNATASRLIAGLAQAQKDAAFKKFIDQGVDLQSRKMYKEAEDAYKKALQVDPQNDAAWVNLGTLFQAEERFDDAVACYNQALKLNRNNKDAIQGIQTATAAKQDKAVDALYKQGGDLFKAGRYDEAIQAYQQVLRLNPKDPATHFDLGATYQAKGDFDSAIQEYRIAASLDPKEEKYAKAIQNATDAKAKPIIDAAVKKHGAKDYAGAIDLYKQALTLQPKNADVWYNLASAQYAIQSYREAEQSYKRALEIDPKGQVNDLYLIGCIEENYSNGPEALKFYLQYLNQARTGTYAGAAKERVTALNKNVNDTVKIKSEAELAAIKQGEEAYAQAVELQKQQKYDDAMAAYQKAIQSQPKNSDYLYSMGTCLQAMGKIDDAMQIYQRVIQMDPKNTDAVNAMKLAVGQKVDPIVDNAIKAQTSGDLKGAITLYQQALQLDPKNARAHTNFGTALQQTDDFRGAYKEYQTAYKLDPKNEIGDLYLMGTIDENFDDGNKAWNEYQDYLKAAPGGTYAAQAKARVAVLGKNVKATQKLQTQAQLAAARSAGEAIDAALKLQQAGKYDEAIAEYQKAIAVDPNNDQYWYSEGTAYQAKGDIPNATKCYEKAISLAPKNDTYKQTLAAAKQQQSGPVIEQAVAKHQAGDYKAAIALYKQALNIDPNNAKGYTNLGSAQQAAEQFDDAKASYAQALKLDPKGEVDNNYFIGLLDENANQGRLAIQDYTKYLQAAPRGAYAQQAQQRLSTLKADPSKVQKIVTAAETQKSAEGQQSYADAVSLQQANKFDEAVAAYKKAIAAAPNEPSYYYGLGTCYQAKNDLDNAIENYKKALSLNPKDPNAKSAIKGVQQAKAAPLVNSAIEKQTKKQPPDILGAIADYEAALKIDEDPGTMSYLGTAYQAQNNLPKALYWYQHSIQLDPKAPDAHYFIATVYETMNKKPEAIREYDQYLKLAPTGSYADAVKTQLKALRGK